ncbi:hypothetical protein [Pontibacter vulgaris]|uniref:hypothetical protein n=1 Tax=Pontibacter vulgaris TaxID=2905679 RepID=UPI001FA6DF8B|nr:hypothetical protein [Pontibacter vulgaris]
MVHPYIINTINGLVLLIAGLAGYFAGTDMIVATILAPAFGILLLACSYHLHKHNRFVFNTVTALTLLFGIALATRINLTNFGFNSRDVLLSVMCLSCFVAVAFYIGTFVQERRLGNNSIYKDDL